MDVVDHPAGADRRSLPPGMMIGMEPAADGWPIRRFAWPPPAGREPRGSLMVQAGRGDFIEKYLEALGHWHDRGWQLEGFDWRGQGGSGRFLADASIGHVDSFDRWLDDLDAAVVRWRSRSPGPHILIGHSMGGHLVLRLLAERRPQVDAAVLVSPMLGYQMGMLAPWAAGLIANVACRIGLGERPAWGGGKKAMPAHRERNLTHSPERYQDELWWRTSHPELAIGAPSWGWLRAGLRSMTRLNRPHVLESVQTPVLILATPHDALVSATAIRRAAARLPHGRLQLFETGAHELLREVDEVRLSALAAIDEFIDGVRR